jgi:hypothetical protein
MPGFVRYTMRRPNEVHASASFGDDGCDDMARNYKKNLAHLRLEGESSLESSIRSQLKEAAIQINVLSGVVLLPEEQSEIKKNN